MTDTYTPSLRLQLQATGGNNNNWGVIADTQYQLLESAITGDNGYAGGSGGISINGLTNYTLTTAQGTTDQARQQLYPFVGGLTSPCNVFLPGVVKMGWALNATTGGHSIILAVGAGQTLTLPPGGGWTFFYCDGVNITTPTMSLGAGVTGTNVVNFSQFAQYITPSGYITLPGGLIIQWGVAVVTLASAGVGTFPFPKVFPNNVFTCLVSNGDATASANPVFAANPNVPNAAGMEVYVPNAGNLPYRVNWIAVGN